MQIEKIKRETQKLQKTIDRLPKILKFRGRRVAHVKDWKWGDWSTIPDKYLGLITNPRSTPLDWYRDYVDLMKLLKDPAYGNEQCWTCAIYLADWEKKEIHRHQKYWDEHGGETGKEEDFREMGERYRLSCEKGEAMRNVKWRLFNELGGANNRTCSVVNYFRCPYGEEWRTLQEDGAVIEWTWSLIEWYDRHWNRDPYGQPPEKEMKWYHFDEPQIIDVTDFDDIVRAMEDGRLERDRAPAMAT